MCFGHGMATMEFDSRTVSAIQTSIAYHIKVSVHTNQMSLCVLVLNLQDQGGLSNHVWWLGVFSRIALTNEGPSGVRLLMGHKKQCMLLSMISYFIDQNQFILKITGR